MEEKKFLTTFILSITGLFLIYVAVIEFLNPELTGALNIRAFEPWTTNIEYVKFKNLGNNEEVETLIIGSSTSEAYHPSDVDEIFNTKSYVISLGGADTPTRSIFFKEALKKFKNLKRIIYIADFFEFNKDEAKPAVAFNREMGSNLASFARPSTLGFIRYYFNHQLLESSFNIIKRKRKDKRIQIASDGSTARSMVLSSIAANAGYKSLIGKAEKKKLMEYVLENYITYSRSVLNNFNELNEKVHRLYTEMLQLADKRKLELVFVMSPYQADFREKLFQIEGIKERYAQWENRLQGYAFLENVTTINATRDFIATEPMSGSWRDGIHYSRPAAFTLLKRGLSEKAP